MGTKRTEYAYALSILDQAVGAIVSTLERLEMMDNTYLIFASDNGGRSLPHIVLLHPVNALGQYIILTSHPLSIHPLILYPLNPPFLRPLTPTPPPPLGCYSAGGKNGPLRGTKGTLLEGGTKVDAFVYSPSLLDRSVQGTTYARLMHVSNGVVSDGVCE